jgi:excinuclease UvrABC helicase subunit UvrB
MNNTEENRRIVAAGLEHRRELRMEAQREEAQEAYERDMILACNLHCADVKKDREDRERTQQRRAEIAKAKADMERAATTLDFMAAARYRDRMYELQKELDRLTKI